MTTNSRVTIPPRLCCRGGRRENLISKAESRNYRGRTGDNRTEDDRTKDDQTKDDRTKDDRTKNDKT